jgi:hypothetical protein
MSVIYLLLRDDHVAISPISSGGPVEAVTPAPPSIKYGNRTLLTTAEWQRIGNQIDATMISECPVQKPLVFRKKSSALLLRFPSEGKRIIGSEPDRGSVSGRSSRRFGGHGIGGILPIAHQAFRMGYRHEVD